MSPTTVATSMRVPAMHGLPNRTSGLMEMPGKTSNRSLTPPTVARLASPVSCSAGLEASVRMRDDVARVVTCRPLLGTGIQVGKQLGRIRHFDADRDYDEPTRRSKARAREPVEWPAFRVGDRQDVRAARARLRMQFEAHVAVRVPSGSRSARCPSWSSERDLQRRLVNAVPARSPMPWRPHRRTPPGWKAVPPRHVRGQRE